MMANPGKPLLRQQAIQLRVVGRKSYDEISKELNVSIGTCSRWLKEHSLTKEEREARAAVGHTKLIGRRQSPETISKRVDSSREKISANSRLRFGGAWIRAKEDGSLTYVSNIPCRNGHTERYTSSKACVQCQFLKVRSMGFAISRLCAGARYRAKALGLKCDLDATYVQSIWPEDNRCPILRVPFELRRGDKNRGPLPLSPTIDRIVPEKGYVQGNVAIMSARANTMKQDCCSPEVFQRMSEWLTEQLALQATR